MFKRCIVFISGFDRTMPCLLFVMNCWIALNRHFLVMNTMKAKVHPNAVYVFVIHCSEVLSMPFNAWALQISYHSRFVIHTVEHSQNRTLRILAKVAKMERGTFYCGNCNLVHIQNVRRRDYCKICFGLMTIMPVYVQSEFYLCLIFSSFLEPIEIVNWSTFHSI